MAERLADANQILRHLQHCDATFAPPLSQRVDLDAYAHKLAQRALLYCHWEQDALTGLIAAYHNQGDNSFFITNVSVVPSLQRRGVASTLLKKCLDAARQQHVTAVKLEVHPDNANAIALYESHGFQITERANNAIIMALTLG